jgi:hypothetical protein
MAQMMRLAVFLEHHTEPASLVGPGGQQLPLPLEVCGLLVQVVDAMKAAKAITVAPLEQRLTTQQAADLLGVSRPTLIKLLRRTRSPTKSAAGTAGSGLSDVLAYRSWFACDFAIEIRRVIRQHPTGPPARRALSGLSTSAPAWRVRGDAATAQSAW